MDNEHQRVDTVNQTSTRPVVVDGRGRGAGHGTTLLTWLALLLALAALALAWTAFNRTGEDLEQRIQQEISDAAGTVEQRAPSVTQPLDAGPDGVDEDDTDTGAGTTNDASTSGDDTPTSNQ